MIQQTFIDSRKGEFTEVTIDLDALRLTIGDASIDCTDPEALRRAYIAQVGALLEANPFLDDADGGPARLLDLDSVARYQDAPAAEVHPAILAAREALRERWPEWLADSLVYTIVLDEVRAAAPCPVGVSRRGGDPDLPAGFPWPGERFFVTQLDLAELAPLDLEHALPPRGLLSLFVSYGCSDNLALYFADTSTLERRATPASIEPLTRSYRIELVEHALHPRPALMTGTEDLAGLELPDEVRAGLRAGLGLELELENDRQRIFGTPTGDGGEDVLFDSDRPADLYDPATFTRYHGPRTLALQQPFIDGFLYLVVPPCDLRVGDLRNAQLRYWGT